jgi:membrane protein required for colicin V production
MNWLDIVIILVLILSVIGGIMNGLVKSLFGLLGLIIGVVLAGHFYVALADHMGFISNVSTARIVAFIIIFATVSVVASLLGLIFNKIISASPLSGINRLLGGVLGLVTGAISIAALLIILIKFTGIGDSVSNSKIAMFLVDKLPLVLALLPKEFDTVKQYFQ